MQKQLDLAFRDVPAGWTVCGGTACPRAEECLRHLAFLSIPKEQTTASCVLPWALEDGKCAYFVTKVPVVMARGFEGLIRQLKSRDLRHDLRIALSDYLGSKGSYDRYKKGERWLAPEQQEWIIAFLRRYGVEVERPFDEYKVSFFFKFLSKS